MRKPQRILFAALAFTTALGLGACQHGPQLMEAKDKDMTVQLMQLPNTPDDGGLSYKVRIIPAKTLMEATGGQSRTAMWYKMDSCFYIKNGQAKTYAALVQAVANGVGGSYEYLLQFETDKPLQGADSAAMVYADRYLNHKAYTLKLKN